jgi:amidase
MSDADAATWRARALELTCLAGLAGAPVVVVPALSDEGLPVGAALVGGPDTDLALLALAGRLL